jgi:hypothetical protein
MRPFITGSENECGGASSGRHLSLGRGERQCETPAPPSARADSVLRACTPRDACLLILSGVTGLQRALTRSPSMWAIGSLLIKDHRAHFGRIDLRAELMGPTHPRRTPLQPIAFPVSSNPIDW